MSMPPKPPGYYTDKLFTCDDMDKAIQKEREECAKVCDELSKKYFWDDGYSVDCAESIHARGQE